MWGDTRERLTLVAPTHHGQSLVDWSVFFFLFPSLFFYNYNNVAKPSPPAVVFLVNIVFVGFSLWWD